MNKISAFWNLFRQGEEVANAKSWKNAQLLGNLFLALATLAAAFGYNTGLSATDTLQLGGSAVLIANCVLTLVTSKKVGLPARSGPADEGRSADDARGA